VVRKRGEKKNSEFRRERRREKKYKSTSLKYRKVAPGETPVVQIVAGETPAVRA